MVDASRRVLPPSHLEAELADPLAKPEHQVHLIVGPALDDDDVAEAVLGRAGLHVPLQRPWAAGAAMPRRCGRCEATRRDVLHAVLHLREGRLPRDVAHEVLQARKDALEDQLDVQRLGA
eukprot:scaffold3504_cov240-Pinguiococcus_pyrenoidosus.AAC.52